MEALHIHQLSGTDPVQSILHDTRTRGKQMLIFVNTRRRAEAVAERLAKRLPKREELTLLAEEILHVLEPPTAQCKRLAGIIPHGIAFHHAGLAARQKALLEDAFRQGRLHVLVATPTLAAGMDLPAFRVVILDATRYADGWQQPLSMLDYLQMSGRAGRPRYDDHGEAYLIARDEQHAQALHDAFFTRQSERVESKLGVQPTLRRLLLGLISMGFTSEERISSILSETLYAKQYASPLTSMIRNILHELAEAGFISMQKQDDFTPASMLTSTLTLTRIGRRVAELYIDPLTAIRFLTHLPHVHTKPFDTLLLISLATEARPLPGIRKHEEELLWDQVMEADETLLHEADDPLRVVKHARILHEWITEASEEALYEQYGITPGELAQRRMTAEWLAYTLAELARLTGMQATFFQKLRVRIIHGVREDLLSLVMLKGIGRKRARLLARHGFRSREDILARQAEAERLLGTRLVQRILMDAPLQGEARERQGRLHDWQ